MLMLLSVVGNRKSVNSTQDPSSQHGGASSAVTNADWSHCILQEAGLVGCTGNLCFLDTLVKRVQALVSELDLRNLRSKLNLHSSLNFQNVLSLSLLFPSFPFYPLFFVSPSLSFSSHLFFLYPFLFLFFSSQFRFPLLFISFPFAFHPFLSPSLSSFPFFSFLFLIHSFLSPLQSHLLNKYKDKLP